MTHSERRHLPSHPPTPAHVDEGRTAGWPGRTRTLVMALAPSLQEARTPARVPAAPLADAPPESSRIRQALDEMSLVIDMPRDLALEVASNERSGFVRRGWARTMPMPPKLEVPAPRPAAAGRNQRARAASKLFACSLVLGAAISFVVHGASAAAAESSAMRTRGAATPAAPPGHQPTSSADEAASGNAEPPAAHPTESCALAP